MSNLNRFFAPIASILVSLFNFTMEIIKNRLGTKRKLTTAIK